MTTSELSRPIPVEAMAENSYRNFHARGLDYLCLKRSPNFTVKAYFFDGPESDLANLPELVIPHDHRYAFGTYCLTGHVTNRMFTESRTLGKRYDRLAWFTPLLGGKGFAWESEVNLSIAQERHYRTGAKWLNKHTDIHTLQVHKAGTVLLLTQLADVVPVGVPTMSYSLRGSLPPTMDGKYDRMSIDVVMHRVEQLCAMVGDRQLEAWVGA